MEATKQRPKIYWGWVIFGAVLAVLIFGQGVIEWVCSNNPLRGDF